MVREFKRFMIFYGLTYSEFQIVKGDFMAQAPQEQVKRAKFVFYSICSSIYDLFIISYIYIYIYIYTYTYVCTLFNCM